jgi:hypothetical protein
LVRVRCHLREQPSEALRESIDGTALEQVEAELNRAGKARARHIGQR